MILRAEPSGEERAMQACPQRNVELLGCFVFGGLLLHAAPDNDFDRSLGTIAKSRDTLSSFTALYVMYMYIAQLGYGTSGEARRVEFQGSETFRLPCMRFGRAQIIISLACSRTGRLYRPTNRKHDESQQSISHARQS